MTQKQIRAQFNKSLRDLFIKKHKFCQYCGEPAKHVHHIIPIAVGGDNRESNLVSLCYTCHGLIHNKTFNDNWRELQRIGIEKAKAAGKFKGASIKKIDREKYLKLKQEWQTRQITKGIFAQQLKVSRPTLDKILKNEEIYLKNFLTKEGKE